MTTSTFTLADSDAIKAIGARIPGWSGPVHYLFFKSLLAAHPAMKRFLMLGVYYGRDIAFILDILARYHPGREMEIVGVDKFNDEACDDWLVEKRGMTWEQAFNCAPPDVDFARLNTRSPFVTILKEDDAKFLSNCPTVFDCVYFDTSHDEVTVIRQLDQGRRLAPGGILCGDDYSDAGTWGVRTAVSRSFTSHEVFHGWIWHAPAANLLASVAEVSPA